jgi:carboxyvinyl-carboxyphosphonate phosphorylmutase
MNVTERRERFRDLLAGDHLVFPAQVWNPVSAQIAEDLGYEVGFVAGPMSAHALLGAPNHYLLLLTATELAQHIRRISRASSLPLLTVAEDGFGNALNVMRTVEEFEAAGASALTLDDPVLPFRFGNEAADIGLETWEQPWREFTPIEEQVGKIKAALEARLDKSLVIVARTRALAPGGEAALNDVLQRVAAYERAGADALMVGDIHTRAELEAIHAATSLPILMNSASSLRLVDEGESDDEVLLANGVRFRNTGNHAYWASVKATYDALSAMRDIKDGRVPDVVPRISPELKARLSRLDRYAAWSKRFMS